MKRKMFIMVACASLILVSCSVESVAEDIIQDFADAVNSCSNCTNEDSVVTQYCDNGDGTITATTNGENSTINLADNSSFEEFISTMESEGSNCN